MAEVSVREITSEPEARTIYPVVRQLRPHLSERDFVSALDRMRHEGYRLAAAYIVDERVNEKGGEKPVGAAGFRVQEYLAHGKHLYVDDLVTADGARSGGVGKAMLDWLEAEAQRSGCASLQLDSGVGRKDAHRFYFRERMTIASYHFTKDLQKDL